MSRGINKAILIGNVTLDPEVRYTSSGAAVTSLSLATNEKWRDKSTGEAKERAEFHRVSIFGRLAEIAAQYLRKGSKVYIEGSIRTRKWQAQDGTDRYTTEIMANEMQMLDSASNSGAQNQNYAPQNNYQQSQAPQNQPQDGGIDFDDDVPFN